jgi:hypothetical protein
VEATVELELPPYPRCQHNKRRTLCTPLVGTLLNATAYAQSTVAVPLGKVRRFLSAAIDPRWAPKSVLAQQPQDQPPQAQLGHFSSFLKRVDAVCRAEALPEPYCALLALSGHLIRTIARSSADLHIKVKYAVRKRDSNPHSSLL